MLAIVVVSYNTCSLLRACLKSVFDGLVRFEPGEKSGESQPAGEVWVVDNASTDGSPEMVRREFPTARLILNSENRGFAAANNQVLQRLLQSDSDTAVKPDAVLLLNPDTVVCDDALWQMFHALMADPRVAVVGACLTYPDGRFQHSAFRFPDLFQVFFDFFAVHHRLIESRLNGRYPRSLYDQGRPFAIDHPLGAALMARREAIEQVGLLDERFFMYCEEIDWCMRFKRHGWQVVCAPQARIVHYAGQSTRQFREKMFVALWKSRFLLFQKHYPAVFRRIAHWLVAAGLRRKLKEARAAAARGEIDQTEVDQLESARRQIMELSVL